MPDVPPGATDVACALCGARETRRLYTKFGWGIERCRRCRLVYANPRAPADAILGRYSSEYFWNEYLPSVGAAGGQVDCEALDQRYAPMLRLLAQAAPKGGRLLEVGTGAGLFLKAAARAGWTTSGIELSSDGALFAQRLGLDVRQESAERMSFPPASFDVVTMFEVIEHLFDPGPVLASVRRALRPGGQLVMTTPNFDALSRRALGVNWAVISPLEHLYYFTARTLGSLLERNGFPHVAFVRTFPAWGPMETMNYLYTHDPHGWRARAYGVCVQRFGDRSRLSIQRLNLADTLLAVVR